MSADAGRVGRFYTTARRHPWVLGKVADWRIPLGPYTPAQITIAVGGGFVLIKTVPLWSWMGPVPLVAWVLAVWAMRRPKIQGRAPLQAALGWALLAWQPAGGRIGGRAARDRSSCALFGGFTVEGAPATTTVRARALRPHEAHSAGRARAAARSFGDRAAAAAAEARPGVESGVQQLLARAQRSGGAR